MQNQPQLFMGNSFHTRLDLDSPPTWKPLEELAEVVWRHPHLPQFHPAEFMYMAALHGVRRRVTIHLYKHRDTRRYLNLDDRGYAYAYQYRLDEEIAPESGGRYRRYRNIEDALDRGDLDAFETERLFRSFPPEEWPSASLK